MRKMEQIILSVVLLASLGIAAEQWGGVMRIEVTPEGECRLVVAPEPEQPENYVLESSTSLHEWSDTGVMGTPTSAGFGFLAPLTPGQSKEFFSLAA